MKFLKSLLALTLISGFSAQAMRAPMRPTVRSTPRAAATSAPRIAARFERPAALHVERPRLASYAALSAYSRLPAQAPLVMVPTRHFSSSKPVQKSFWENTKETFRSTIYGDTKTLLRDLGNAIQNNQSAVEKIIKQLSKLDLDFSEKQRIINLMIRDAAFLPLEQQEHLAQIFIKFDLHKQYCKEPTFLEYSVRSGNYGAVKAYAPQITKVIDIWMQCNAASSYLNDVKERSKTYENVAYAYTDAVLIHNLTHILEFLKAIQFPKQTYSTHHGETTFTFEASNYEEFEKGLKNAFKASSQQQKTEKESYEKRSNSKQEKYSENNYQQYSYQQNYESRSEYRSYSSSHTSTTQEPPASKDFSMYQQPEEKELIAFYQKTKDSNLNAFDLFGIAGALNMNKKAAKKTYYDLIRKFHPDKFNYDETLKRIATEVSKKINNAYSKVK